MYSLACLRQPRYEPVKLQLWLANSFACCSAPSSKVQISFIDRRIHFADSKARPAALFFVSRKGGGRRQERFDHLHRLLCGIAITSSARKRNDSEIVRLRALADSRLMISSNVAGGHKQAMLARGAL